MNKALMTGLLLAAGIAASGAQAGHYYSYGHGYVVHQHHGPVREVHHYYHPGPGYYKAKKHPRSYRHHATRYRHSPPPRHYRHTYHRAHPGVVYVQPRSGISGSVTIRF